MDRLRFGRLTYKVQKGTFGPVFRDLPEPLDDETLDTIEREGNRAWLTELVRVYRAAKAFDAAEDVSPFHRFFANELLSSDGKVLAPASPSPPPKP